MARIHMNDLDTRMRLSSDDIQRIKGGVGSGDRILDGTSNTIFEGSRSVSKPSSPIQLKGQKILQN